MAQTNVRRPQYEQRFHPRKIDLDLSVTTNKVALDFKFKVDMVLLYVFAAEEPENERDESVAQLALATYDYWMKSEAGLSDFVSMYSWTKVADDKSTYRKASVILQCINNDRLEGRHMPNQELHNVVSLDKHRKGE